VDAVDRRLDKYKIEPMDLANMRQNGVRSLDIMCFGCRHEVIINVDQYPGKRRPQATSLSAVAAG
jgi:hypothetical protein